jgi:hypothetical protein
LPQKQQRTGIIKRNSMKIIFLLLSIQNLASYFTGHIAPDERVIFFPTSASQWNETHWKVPIHGWIFQPKELDTKRRALKSVLRTILQVPTGSREEHIFNHRIQAFVVDNERWKRPKISLAGKDYSTALSCKNGHFKSTLIISDDDLQRRSARDGSMKEEEESNKEGYATTTAQATIPTQVSFYSSSSIHVGRSGGDNSSNNKNLGVGWGTPKIYSGVVMLVPPRGITIVSDIDDTIKVTNVVNKKVMLQNTFLKEFIPVPGMAEVYQRWCTTGIEKQRRKHQNIYSDDDGGDDDDDDRYHPCHLHLLSASLYQLYEDLETFRINCGFPSATYTLKTIRPRDARQTIQTLLEDAYDFKRRALVGLIEEYPLRTFVLVGDTGERDPLVYASMVRDYPQQVKMILLRYVPKHEHPQQHGTSNVGVDDDVHARVADIMIKAGIPREKWMVFEDASELNTITLN